MFLRARLAMIMSERLLNIHLPSTRSVLSELVVTHFVTRLSIFTLLETQWQRRTRGHDGKSSSARPA
jgi:hypothetical protein